MNLCLEDTASGKCIKEALNFAIEVVELIKYSPKWQIVFEKVQKQHEDSPISGIQNTSPNKVDSLCKCYARNS